MGWSHSKSPVLANVVLWQRHAYAKRIQIESRAVWVTACAGTCYPNNMNAFINDGSLVIVFHKLGGVEDQMTNISWVAWIFEGIFQNLVELVPQLLREHKVTSKQYLI